MITGLNMTEGLLYGNVFFFRQTNQSGDFVYFEDYEPDDISCQYSHFVCATRIKLIEVQSKKKSKIKKWKMSKDRKSVV